MQIGVRVSLSTGFDKWEKYQPSLVVVRSPNVAAPRPETPPNPQRSSSYEPHRADSQGSIVSSSSGSSSSRLPTNFTLTITPLRTPFFKRLILDALRRHFASFSTTYVHTSSPPPLRPRLVQGLQTGLNNSTVPYIPGYPSNLSTCCRSRLQTPRRGTCTSGERSMLRPANSIHTRNHPACFLWCTHSIDPRPTKRAAPQIGSTTSSTRATRTPFSGRPSPPPSRTRTRLPDLTPRKLSRRLRTDTRGAAQRGIPR